MTPILVSDAMREYRLTYEQAVQFPRIEHAPDQRAWLDERQIAHHVNNQRPFLSLTRAEVLQAIRVYPPGLHAAATLRELADFLGMTENSVRASVEHLKKAGLVTRPRYQRGGLKAVTR